MTKYEITFCNRAYSKKWYKNLRKQNPSHFEIMDAIIEEIQIKDGGDISRNDIGERRPDIGQKISDLGLKLYPSRGQMLMKNGYGIRHAKYSPSKNIAIIWEKIGNTIYITFDDHAPIRYHRAIRHLREIKLGKTPFPKHARVSGRFYRRMRQFWKKPYQRKFYGFNPDEMNY